MKFFLKKVECPYCLAQFFLSKAPFRCQSPKEVCVPIKDEVYANHYPLHKEQEQGQVIKVGFSFKKAKCGLCLKKTSTRICPACHAELPLNFNNYLISIIGATEAGKTAYLTALIKELLWQEAAEFGLTLTPLSMPPLENHYAFHFHTVSQEGTLILKEINSLKKEARFLKASKGFICLMDVLSAIDQEELEPATTQAMARYLEDFLKEQGVLQIKTPTAFVLTRLDMFKEIFPKSSLLLQPTGESHPGVYINSAGIALSKEVMGYLGAWFGWSFLKRLQYLFSRRRFFSISSKEPSLKTTEPFLWLLKGLKLFKKREESLFFKWYNKASKK